jgi:hypothetical protein
MKVHVVPPSGRPPSAGEELYRQYVRKETSERDYHAMTAALTASNLHWYPPLRYLPMTQSVNAYVTGRLNDTTSYSVEAARKLGDWFRETQRALDENSHNLSHVLWCIEKLKAVGLHDQCERLDTQARRYQEIKPPYEDIDRALRVKSLDATSRQRGGD